MIAVGAAGTEQDDVAVVGRASLGAAGDRREEGVADVEHDQGDRAAATGAQLAGGVVAHVARLSMAARTRSTAAGETVSRPLRTFDTVPTETPA